jgi:hypothetical protein
MDNEGAHIGYRRWAKEEVCERTSGKRFRGRHLRKGNLLELFLYLFGAKPGQEAISLLT